MCAHARRAYTSTSIAEKRACNGAHGRQLACIGEQGETVGYGAWTLASEKPEPELPVGNVGALGHRRLRQGEKEQRLIEGRTWVHVSKKTAGCMKNLNKKKLIK